MLMSNIFLTVKLKELPVSKKKSLRDLDSGRMVMWFKQFVGENTGKTSTNTMRSGHK